MPFSRRFSPKQLSHACIHFTYGWSRESNPLSWHYKRHALPTELQRTTCVVDSNSIFIDHGSWLYTSVWLNRFYTEKQMGTALYGSQHSLATNLRSVVMALWTERGHHTDRHVNLFEAHKWEEFWYKPFPPGYWFTVVCFRRPKQQQELYDLWCSSGLFNIGMPLWRYEMGC